ncbi:glutamyl-tRNA reductase [Robertkochia sediminum]|uniref:glutamyl-tRNA reductase n=1 Tax=Robertkochia sediminum TaxID=2785326 RepID=UPI0019328A9A|nr:glutamyl-tRNA reductase [Robertkochia sediminum]MBL7471841.1 glutamyl-tRNA reductase [Robertkochia sediminum]
MKAYNISKHSSFYVVGLSYKKADVHMRGRFSLNDDGRTNLLRQAKSSGIDGIMVTSTCNRTELFGFAQHPFQLIQLLCGNTNGTVEEFQSVGYVYKNYEAINHMFRVGTGLDSQILGDFEIISQIRQSFVASREEGMANPFLERLCNSVIQASKRIKNETELSSGATSVAFASVQYILSKVPNISEKNILLFGTGKIGRNTCENLVKHTTNDHIVLINRTRDKAEKIAGKFNLIVKEFGQLQEEIRKADVLVVATGAQHPTVSKELIHTSKPLLILDLSVPSNVDENVNELSNVTLVHIDQLSKMTADTLKRREKFVPMAEGIINEVEGDFKKWLETRKFAPTIKALKKKLKSIKEAEIDNQRKKIKDFNDEHAEILSDRIIQKITTHFANHLRESPNSSDDSIELIKKVFQLETSK